MLAAFAVGVANTTRRCETLVTRPIERDPRPLAVTLACPPVEWPVRQVLKCPDVIPPSGVSFENVLEARRSLRCVSVAPLREIINAVAYATRPRYNLASDELERTRRPSPSAGALHPIEVVLVDWRTRHRVMRYVPLRHEIHVLYPIKQSKLIELVRAIREVLPLAHGTGVFLLGSDARVASAYENPLSLLWRDAGALIQTLHLTATAFRLAYCPIGLLGHGLVDALPLRWAL